MIDRKSTAAWLDNMGYPKLAEAIMDEKRFPDKIVRCKDCKYGMLEPSFPHQWFCKFKGDEWNNGDYFCGHAKRRKEVQ